MAANMAALKFEIVYDMQKEMLYSMYQTIFNLLHHKIITKNGRQSPS